MTENDILKTLSKEYVALLNENKTRRLNEENFAKLLQLKAFFERQGCKFETIDCNPADDNAGFTVMFNLLDLTQPELSEFCNLLSTANAVSFDATLSGESCISISFANVFEDLK